MLPDGPAKIAEYTRVHRKQREDQVVQTLRTRKTGFDGPEAEAHRAAMELVKVIYHDVPVELHIPAAGGVIQILRKLEARKSASR